MGAGAGPCQAVELEGMREGAIGERRRRGLDRRSASAEDTAFAAGPGARGVVDNDAAPRQGAAANPRSDGVDDAVLGLLHDRCGQVLVPESRRIARQSYVSSAIFRLPKPRRDCFATLAMTTRQDVIARSAATKQSRRCRAGKGLSHGNTR